MTREAQVTCFHIWNPPASEASLLLFPSFWKQQAFHERLPFHLRGRHSKLGSFFSLKSVGLSERICFYATKEEKNGLDKLSGAGSEIKGQKVHRKMTKSALKLKMLRQKIFFFKIHELLFFLIPHTSKLYSDYWEFELMKWLN